MCQLLGMNCNTPTDIVFSFEGFRRRGGLTDHHADGFGIGFFEGRGVRLFHDDKPSANSPVADLVKAYQIKSENVIAHIRKATQGQTSLANTHPFMREMWGGYWLFAHNGHLKNFFPKEGGFYRAVGNTDSERAFCYILEQLRRRFSERPDEHALFDAVAELTAEIREYGLFNFMMSNGECLFAHASTLLHYIVRKAPFGEAHLIDDDVKVDFAAVTTPNDKVAVIATLPLTANETWLQLAVNELVMFREGDIVRRHAPEHPVYMSAEEGLAIARAAGVSV
ncbi:class II glutamine amidotransferase [Neisseria dentiae]|uniref:Class II glutamine amidotransferase n=2 Tax=Neisseria dentiae TaxID=194197 RepID=A0A1X3D766_9NEIS|nr:class II glutamine amidotransferase [Neisseria dentiae]OSI15789.1 class II glutamine amidotransferase [Neisseria dentiae]QMT44633.1 class II glutamine amidotransferase [Neisseria dentiae]STZ50340.1 putative class-II glutamine amidotransferase [Neisseria dentiae]